MAINTLFDNTESYHLKNLAQKNTDLVKANRLKSHLFQSICSGSDIWTKLSPEKYRFSIKPIYIKSIQKTKLNFQNNSKI